MHRRTLALATGLLISLVFAACATTKTGTPDKPALDTPLAVKTYTGKAGPAWKDFDQAVKEQKFEKASKEVEKILARARDSGDSENVTRGIIRWVQLRIALHGYETAVRFFREQQWPQDLLSSSVLHLFYAHTLQTYARAYSWEIRKRVKVASKHKVDLKKWTMREIYAEAQKAYDVVWAHRKQLGDLPIGHLGEFVTANDYPKRIRGTLRDALSYSRVGLLSDTNGWRPEQLNEKFKLDLDQLIGPPQRQAVKGKPAKVQVSDPQAHPLMRIALILSDLEAWNRSEKRPEAALEARLARLRTLHSNFSDASSRKAIRDDLVGALELIEDKPWWSMGMHQLSLFEAARRDTWDNKIRSRRVAAKCAEGHPNSIGAQRCRHQIASIEAPNYSLSGMASDAPDRQSVAVSYRNIDRMYFRAYPIDLEARIRAAKDYNLYPNGRALRALVDTKPAFAWDVGLTPTTDFKSHQHFVTPPIKAPGAYVIVGSMRKDFSARANQVRALFQAVGDLVILSHHRDDAVTVRVLSGASGKPVKGAKVQLYEYNWRKGHQPVAAKTTNANGEALFTYQPKKRWTNYFLFARKGAHVAIDPSYLRLRKRTPTKERLAALLYTDRSIYRPLQRLHYKTIVYSGERRKANYRTAPNSTVKIVLKDANRQTVATQEVTTNAFGTASGTFDLPAGRLLGRWQLSASVGGAASLRVEEYKRPTFEVTFKSPTKGLRLNKKATFNGEARYYFGLPVTRGKVKWTATRRAIYPWWWWYGGYGGGARTQTVGFGTTRLKADGTFEVVFTPEADEQLAKTSKDIAYQYNLNVDVTDEGGETRAAAASHRVGFVAIRASVSKPVGFFIGGKPGALTLRRTNLDGAAAPGKGRYRVTRLVNPTKTLRPAEQPMPALRTQQQKAAFRTAGDRQRKRWSHGYDVHRVVRGWKDGAEVVAGEVGHDKQGKAKVTLPALPAGSYRVHYESLDPYGAKYTTSSEFFVAGKRQSGINLPGLMLVEDSSVRVGDTARVLVHSGLAKQLVYLDIYKDGKRIKRRTLRAGRDASLVEIPIREEDRGGMGLRLTVVNDHQLITAGRSIYVPWDDKQLDLSFSTFRDKLRPGQTETWTVKVTGPSKKKTAVAAAEILAYMYDRSLDVFARHSPPSPQSLFPFRTSTPWTNSSLKPAGTRWVRGSGMGLPGYRGLSGDRLRFHSGYGIGGPGRRGRRRVGLGASGTGRGGGGVDDFARAPAATSAKDGDELKAKPKKARAKRYLKSVAAEAPRPSERQAGGGQAKKAPLRSNFSETAFFQPHLRTGKDGSVSFTFTVPDSVTSWNVWVHAVTRDLKSGSVKKKSRTVKELMVRPYLPRFLREGDAADLKVVVNNASKNELNGTLKFDIVDPETNKSLLASFGLKAADASAPFTVKAGGGANLTFPITTPKKLGLVAFKVVASTDSFSDGELRPLPILPGRMHLFQSRFVTLDGADKRTMTFADLAKDDDPTRVDDQMVVTVDGQLFYSVLSALPYLVNYPYESTEATLNRFLATGILGSMFASYPAVAAMAKKLSARKTRLETFDALDPNRKMALEETPWVRQSKGGTHQASELANVLDPRVTKATRDSSLLKLKKAQTSSGAFPWFPGGPPSPYVTLYLLHGFSKALEFGVDVPKDMIRRGWRYLHNHYVRQIVHTCMALNGCWEFITFVNYVLSNYPDKSWYSGTFSKSERTAMLDFSFRHWKRHSPYLKGYLALTLHREKRPKAATLVWESVMDSAKRDKDMGTYWAAEDRSWLWYNDTIETHAFAVRTVMEVTPKDKNLSGLVQWLLLNKKLNHWKSTRATSEVLYSLAHYMKKTGTLGNREEIDVKAGGALLKRFVFEPDTYTGKKNQIVIEGKDIDPNKTSSIVVEKATKGFAFASSTWHFSTERPPKEARGDFLKVTRTYYKRTRSGNDVVLVPLKEGVKLVAGDEVEVQLSLRTKHEMQYVHLRDPRAAGLEPVSTVSKHKWDLGVYWYEEVRDSGTNFFFEKLPMGEYTFKYRLRVAISGTYKVAPATVQPMYAPEFTAYSAGAVVRISAK